MRRSAEVVMSTTGHVVARGDNEIALAGDTMPEAKRGAA
jgi:hypothetical protein